LSNTQHNTVQCAESEAPGETAETLGTQVLSLLPTLRMHSVSLFNGNGDVQWLSQGALGPDEQSVVETAIATLTATTTRAHFDATLADNRAALILAVRTPRAQLAGLVMVLMDAKTLSSGNLAARILTTRMRSVLQKIAIFLVPPPPLSATGISSGIRPFSSATQPLEVTVMPQAPAGDSANDLPVRDVLEILEPIAASDAIASAADGLVWTAPAAGTSTGTTSLAGAPQLRLRELIRLRPGGRTRRYQLVPVAEQQRDAALATLNQLLAWLGENPRVLQGDPLSFTIAVSPVALADPDLPAALTGALAASRIDPGMIGFELREAACVTHRVLAERFVAHCEQARCFAVIDDFTFNTAALELLRSAAVRLLKVETRLVAAAMRDKLAQARVIAIAQAAKVLGTHCAAKYVDSQAGRRWLTAVGFDFTQSSTVEPLERLADPLSA
jgi:EAL domain-containing protein (putative c-di-GMP-specific phosphodiesterase class I)